MKCMGPNTCELRYSGKKNVLWCKTFNEVFFCKWVMDVFFAPASMLCSKQSKVGLPTLPHRIPHVTHWHPKQGWHPHRPFSMKVSRVLLWKFQSTACGNWERVAPSAESKVGPVLTSTFWSESGIPYDTHTCIPTPHEVDTPTKSFQWKSAGFLLPSCSFTVTWFPPWFWWGPPPWNKILWQKKYYHFAKINPRTRA